MSSLLVGFVNRRAGVLAGFDLDLFDLAVCRDSRHAGIGSGCVAVGGRVYGLCEGLVFGNSVHGFGPSIGLVVDLG